MVAIELARQAGFNDTNLDQQLGIYPTSIYHGENYGSSIFPAGIEFNSWKDLFAHCFIVVSREIWMNSWNQVCVRSTFKSFYNELWEVSFTVNLKSFL